MTPDVLDHGYQPVTAPPFADVVTCATGAIAESVAHLSAVRPWTADEVHRARVLCKRLRAVVHLGRDLVPDPSRRLWNARIATAARSLGQSRDRAVLATLLGSAAADAPAAIAARLDLRAQRLVHPARTAAPADARTALLGAFRAAARGWQVRWLDPRPSEPGWAHTRHRLVRLARTALPDGPPGAWHRWRRWVKYACYQLDWMAEAAKIDPYPMADPLRRLGSRLGHLNDLHNLALWTARQRTLDPADRAYLDTWNAAAQSDTRKECAALALEAHIARPPDPD